MGEKLTKLPVSQERISEPASQVWQPFEGFRREIDRLFEDFGRSFWQPSRRSFPAVDVVESESAYEIKAEMPGMDERNIEVKVANGNLTIKGEKQEEKEEKKEGLLFARAQIWLLRTKLQYSRGRRYGQDRGRLQKRCAQRDAAQKT